MKNTTEKQIVYITRDIERAMGCLPDPSVFIISNETDFAKSCKNGYPEQIFLISNLTILDTHELLEHPHTQKLLGTFKHPKIIVFKNTSKIERWCQKHGYVLLNPPSKLAAAIEEKITQLSTLKNITEYMPRYEIKTIEELTWTSTPFVLQFNHSHTGSGTVDVSSKKTLESLKEIFPKRDCRIAPFIEGPIFTSNIVVGVDAILQGNINYQITGMKPFTDLAFATIGNDWGAPHRILNESALKAYELLAEEVGKELQNLGWKGLFGIDAIWSTIENRWYLIEINARQPASASYESDLQRHAQRDESMLTILEAHLKALNGESLKSSSLTKISNGAQIIQRVTKEKIWHTNITEAVEKLTEKHFKIIVYDNTEHNRDLIRIQSPQSVIETHGEYTEMGKEIISILS